MRQSISASSHASCASQRAMGNGKTCRVVEPAMPESSASSRSARGSARTRAAIERSPARASRRTAAEPENAHRNSGLGAAPRPPTTCAAEVWRCLAGAAASRAPRPHRRDVAQRAEPRKGEGERRARADAHFRSFERPRRDVNGGLQPARPTAWGCECPRCCRGTCRTCRARCTCRGLRSARIAAS